MTETGCLLGVENKEKIIALERDMGKVQKLVFWLVTSSFMTLATVIVMLVAKIV